LFAGRAGPLPALPAALVSACFTRPFPNTPVRSRDGCGLRWLGWGRGLGLTLVQEILSQHGFEFSLGPGEDGGAEFRVGF